MGNCGDYRLDHLNGDEPPRLEFLCAVHVVMSEPVDIGCVTAGRRLVTVAEHGRLEGPRLRGRILPGLNTTMLLRPDSIVETEGHLLIEMDDGERVRGLVSGLRWMSAEGEHELAEGRPYDPSWLHSRSMMRFEAAMDGPYAWLTRDFYLVKATRMVDGVDATVWRIM